MEACEHVDGGSAGQVVEDHLVGYGARVGADPLGRDAVVCGEDVGGFVERRTEVFSLDCDKLGGKVFQPAEAAEGLGEGVETGASGGSPGLVRGRDVGKEFGVQMASCRDAGCGISMGWRAFSQLNAAARLADVRICAVEPDCSGRPGESRWTASKLPWTRWMSWMEARMVMP